MKGKQHMSGKAKPGIYLVIEFDWPNPFEPGHGQKARHLHEVVQGKTWIRETAAASGGVGGELSSLWVFWLESYAALERLLRDREDEVAKAYQDFFSEMSAVRDRLREEVVFM
jgi:hypothetical protein